MVLIWWLENIAERVFCAYYSGNKNITENVLINTFIRTYVRFRNQWLGGVSIDEIFLEVTHEGVGIAF